MKIHEAKNSMDALIAGGETGEQLLASCGALTTKLLSSEMRVWEQFAHHVQSLTADAKVAAEAIGQACRPASIVADRPTGPVHIMEAVMAARLVMNKPAEES